MTRWMLVAAVALGACHKASTDPMCAGKGCPYGQVCVIGPSSRGPAATCVKPCTFSFECVGGQKCNCASSWRCAANLPDRPSDACFDPSQPAP